MHPMVCRRGVNTSHVLVGWFGGDIGIILGSQDSRIAMLVREGKAAATTIFLSA